MEQIQIDVACSMSDPKVTPKISVYTVYHLIPDSDGDTVSVTCQQIFLKVQLI